MSQPLIKIVLLVAVLAFVYLAFRGSGKASYRLLWRGYGVLVALAAALAILFPDSTTTVANKLGVARGADLLLYGSVVTGMIVAVTLFRRLGELERRYVELVRLMAIESSGSGPDADAEATAEVPADDSGQSGQ